jgi:hypothetical protein
MKLTLTALSSIFFCAIYPAWAQTPTSDLALHTYRCDQFLAETSHPDDAGKLLRSMMMISWAVGFAASHEKQGIQSDKTAFEMIAAALGDICRDHPTESATNAFAIAVEAASAREGPLGPVAWSLDFRLDNQTGLKITEVSSRRRADHWQSMSVELLNGYFQDIKLGAIGRDQTSCTYDILVKMGPSTVGFLDGVDLCAIKKIAPYQEGGEIKFKTERQQ